MRAPNVIYRCSDCTDAYLLKLIEVAEIHEESLSSWSIKQHHTLVYIPQSDNEETARKLYYAAPGSALNWGTPLAQVQPAFYIEIQFACYVPRGDDYSLYSLPLVPDHVVPVTDTVDCNIKGLMQLQGYSSQLEQMKGNMKLQELLLELMSSVNEDKEGMADQGIEHSRTYIEQHYASEITREQLATIAGLHPDYYSRAFKKKYGMTPIEYLNQVRINHAKQSLLLSNESLRTIAHQVGYSDEFYFSRKFKLEVGVSPTFYIKKIKHTNKIASLKHLVTGHLVAMNVQPYAAVKNNIYPIEDRLEDTISIGHSTAELEKLLEARPELILMREHVNEDLSLKEQIYRQIAPTIILPYHQDWRLHMLSVAHAIGKTAVATEWLERYDTKAERIRRKYASRMEGQTVLIVGIGAEGMCIYGKRNVGSVLYDDLQFAVPTGVEQIIHYQQTDARALQQYDAEHIVLTSYRHDGSERMNVAIRRAVQKLCRQPEWQALKAVRNSSVYPMYHQQHLYTCYTSLSHDLLLDQIDQLLGSYISK